MLHARITRPRNPGKAGCAAVSLESEKGDLSKRIGRDHGAALTARIDTTAQLLAGAFTVLTGGELQPRQDKPAYSDTTPEAKYDADPVPENAFHAAIAD